MHVSSGQLPVCHESVIGLKKRPLTTGNEPPAQGLLTTPVSPADSTTQGWPVLCPLPLLPTGVRAQATPE